MLEEGRGRQPEIQNEVTMARCQMVYSTGIYWLGKCWRAADAKVVLCGVLGFVAYSAHYWAISHRCFDYGFQAALCCLKGSLKLLQNP